MVLHTAYDLFYCVLLLAWVIQTMFVVSQACPKQKVQDPGELCFLCFHTQETDGPVAGNHTLLLVRACQLPSMEIANRIYELRPLLDAEVSADSELQIMLLHFHPGPNSEV